MALLIASVVFISVLTLMVAVWHAAMSTRFAVQERIGRYVAVSPAGREEPAESFKAPVLTGWRAIVRNMSRHFAWSGRSQALERKLTRAGVPLRGAEFAAICAGTMLAGAALMFLVGHGKPVAMLGGAVAGYILPVLVLNIKEARRVKQFNDQLADALILAANSLRTGYSFLQAIEMVSREMPPPASVEFARLQKEISLGVTTEEALANMGTRLGSSDLDLVITAVLIQRQVGGNLAEVLDNIAGTIRERIKLRGEVRTITAQGRISAMIIGALPFVMVAVMYMINPKYIGMLFTHPVGNILLGVALAGQVIGILILRKIVSIEY